MQRLRLEPTRREVGVDGDVVVSISVGTEREKASKSETKKKVRPVPVELALDCVVARQSHVKFARTLKCPKRLNLITRFLFTFL